MKTSFTKIVSLAFSVELLKPTNVGPFEKFEAHFCKNAMNVIYGSCGSGKPTIICSILLAFGKRHRYFDKRTFSGGTITLKTFPNQNSVNIECHGNITEVYQCLLADEAFSQGKCLTKIYNLTMMPFLSGKKRWNSECQRKSVR